MSGIGFLQNSTKAKENDGRVNLQAVPTASDSLYKARQEAIQFKVWIKGVLQFQNTAVGLDQTTFDAVSDSYLQSIQNGTMEMKATGFKTPSSAAELEALLTEIARRVWSGAIMSKSPLLLAAIQQDPKELDCDTSTVCFGHYLSDFGIRASVVVLPEYSHAIIKAELPDGQSVYCETMGFGKDEIGFDVPSSGSASMSNVHPALVSQPGTARLFYSTKEEVRQAYPFSQAIEYNLGKPFSSSLFIVNAYDYFLRGTWLFEHGQYKKALLDFNAAIRLSPKDGSSYLNRAACLRKLDRPQEALNDLSKCIELNTNDASAYWGRGLLHRQDLNKFDEAIKDFSKCIELSPSNPDFYVMRAESFYMLRRFKDARADFTKAIELDPNEPAYYHNRAIVLDALGFKKLAAKDRKKENELRKTK